MSQSDSASSPFQAEKTFSSYNQEQGKTYAEIRRDYHPSVYQTILSHHTATGGQLNTLIDVGCGPGTVVRALGSHFAHVVGLDPSEGMLATARSFGGVTSTSEPFRYEVSTAEELGANLTVPIQNASIDLITAASAAHWFDMARFWPSAARVLKPGGSVALWASGGIEVHPSTPNAAAIQAAMEQHRERHLKAYHEPGNVIAGNRYRDLPLPWSLAPPIPEFDESTFLRKDWEAGELFFVGEPEVNMDMYEKIMGTGSPVTRWRKAHPDDVGTERDVIRMLRREIERLLHEAGVEKGKERMRGTVRGAVLIAKKIM